MRLNANARIYLAVLALGLFTVLWSLFAENYRFESKLLPIVVGGIVAFLAAVGFGNALRAPRHAAETLADGEEDEATGESWMAYFVHFAWVAGFLLTIYVAGFLVAIPAFLFVYTRRLGGSYRAAALSAALMTAVIYGAFEMGLDVELHRGLIFA